VPPGLASIQLVAAVAAGYATVPAAAQEPPFRFELTPYAAYRIGGEFEPESAPDDIDQNARHLDLHEGNAEGLILDILTHEGNTQWEALYAHQSTELDAQPSFVGGPTLDIDVSNFQFGGTYLFDDFSDTTAPFIALTAGVTRFEPGLDDIDAENYFSWSLGGGVQLRADRRIGVRLEARLFGSIIDDESSLFCVSSPPVSGCALSVEGDILYQFEARVGIVARF
jgi:hypothetical protein